MDAAPAPDLRPVQRRRPVPRPLERPFPGGRASACRAALAGLLAVALAAGCAPRSTWTRTPGLGTAPGPAEPARAPLAAAARPAGAPGALPSGQDPVVVRLAAAEGAERLQVDAPDGTRVVVDRVGATVRAAGLPAAARGPGGPAPAERLHLPAAAAGGAWTLGGRRYAGALEVRARSEGGLSVRNTVPLEEYVAGVVAAELPVWSAPPAELEAQAIAARTYALRARLDRGGADAFLWDDVRDQVYAGVPDLGPSAAQREVLARVRAAVRATRGRVLVQDGRLLDARYCAACGGRSARLLDVFPEAAPFVYPASSCAPCVWIAAEETREHRPGTWRGRVAWRLELGPERLGALARGLGVGGELRTLRPVREDTGGRWIDVEVVGDGGRRVVPFGRLREVLGTAELPSARVETAAPPPGAPIQGRLVLQGLGRGHGVGLCQTGARELAKRGHDSERILRNYYTAAELATLPAAERVP